MVKFESIRINAQFPNTDFLFQTFLPVIKENTVKAYIPLNCKTGDDPQDKTLNATKRDVVAGKNAFCHWNLFAAYELLGSCHLSIDKKRGKIRADLDCRMGAFRELADNWDDDWIGLFLEKSEVAVKQNTITAGVPRGYRATTNTTIYLNGHEQEDILSTIRGVL